MRKETLYMQETSSMTTVELIEKRKESVVDLVSIVVMVLLVYAGVNKLVGIRLFTMELFLCPDLSRYARYLACIIPIIELITGILLLFKRARVICFSVSLALFSFYVYAQFNFVNYVPNIRGGALNSLSRIQSEVLNSSMILLSAISIVVILYNQKYFAQSQGNRKPV